jgi:hypothetical protein
MRIEEVLIAPVVLHRSCSRPDSVRLLVKNTATMRGANSSHDRQRRVPSVWIGTL